ncbi:hypothetical protein DER29_4710 [Micromonospora sp. M71_S20]|nr:hypothetical protein DER29_4710 [Micromonospora sp. M71_S20]
MGGRPGTRTGQSMEDVARELALHIAAVSGGPPAR